MKQGLLLKEAPEEIYVHRCWECDSWFANSLEYQIHVEENHGRMYAWYKEKVINLDGIKETRITKGWVKVQNPNITMRAVWSTKYRPIRRMLITEQERINRAKPGICHCGSKVAKGRFKYCSDSCQADWYKRVTDVTFHRNNFMSDKRQCERCGKDPSKDRWYKELEMDHIIALIFGGHPWHEDNLIGLCHECHKVKTKSDMGILAWWRRESNYDTGPEIPDPQTTLDNVIQFNYVWN